MGVVVKFPCGSVISSDDGDTVESLTAKRTQIIEKQNTKVLNDLKHHFKDVHKQGLALRDAMLIIPGGPEGDVILRLDNADPSLRDVRALERLGGKLRAQFEKAKQ